MTTQEKKQLFWIFVLLTSAVGFGLIAFFVP